MKRVPSAKASPPKKTRALPFKKLLCLSAMLEKEIASGKVKVDWEAPPKMSGYQKLQVAKLLEERAKQIRAGLGESQYERN